MLTTQNRTQVSLTIIAPSRLHKKDTTTIPLNKLSCFFFFVFERGLDLLYWSARKDNYNSSLLEFNIIQE